MVLKVEVQRVKELKTIQIRLSAIHQWVTLSLKTKQANINMAKTKVKEPKKKGAIHLQISINEDTTIVDTDNLLNALQDFPQPAMIKTELVIEATKGKLTRTKVLNTFNARRLFGNKTALEIFASNLMKELG